MAAIGPRGTGRRIRAAADRRDAAAERPQPASTDNGSGLDLLFRPDPYMLDGRYANNAWLQELPKPITKLTWDNAVHLAPHTAQRLALDNQQPVELRRGGRAVRGSVWISPGQADETVVVHLGYGRTQAGRVGNGAGFDAYTLAIVGRAVGGVGRWRSIPPAATYPLANTQMHQTMEGRDMVIAATRRGIPEGSRVRQEAPAKFPRSRRRFTRSGTTPDTRGACPSI